MNTLVFRFFC